MARDKRPSWFKMMLSFKTIADCVPDADLAKGIRAALQYFDTKEMPDLNPVQNIIFSTLKASIDESFSEYDYSVESGRKGGKTKAINDKQRLANVTDPIPPLTDGKASLGLSTEVDVEEEKEVEEDIEKKDKKRVYGTHSNVFLTSKEYSLLMDEYPDFAERTINRLSVYMVEKGKTYAEHYQVIRRWCEEDIEKEKAFDNVPTKKKNAYDNKQYGINL